MSRKGVRARSSQARSAAHEGDRDAQHVPLRPGQVEQEQQQRDHGRGEPGDSGQVEAGGDVAGAPRAVERPVGRDPGQRRGQGDQRDGDVDEEDRPPAQRADQDAADGQAERGGGGAGDLQAAEHAARRLVQAGVPGAAADQQHRGRVGAGGPEADQHPADQQRDQVLGESADEPADGDEDDPGEEHPARPEHLGGLARGGLRDRAGQVEGGYQGRGLPEGHAEPAGDRQQRRRDQRAVDGVEGRADEQRRGELPRERAALPGGRACGSCRRGRRTCLGWRGGHNSLQGLVGAAVIAGRRAARSVVRRRRGPRSRRG